MTELVRVLDCRCGALDEPLREMERIVPFEKGLRGEFSIFVRDVVVYVGYAGHARAVVVVHEGVEHLVHDGVLEGLHVRSAAQKDVLARGLVNDTAPVLVRFQEGVDVDAYHVAVYVLAVLLDRIARYVCERRFGVLMLGQPVLIAVSVIDVQADLGADRTLVGTCPKRGEALQKQVDGLWLQLVDDEVEQVLEVRVRERVARRLRAVDVHEALPLGFVGAFGIRSRRFGFGCRFGFGQRAFRRFGLRFGFNVGLRGARVARGDCLGRGCEEFPERCGKDEGDAG